MNGKSRTEIQPAGNLANVKSRKRNKKKKMKKRGEQGIERE